MRAIFANKKAHIKWAFRSSLVNQKPKMGCHQLQNEHHLKSDNQLSQFSKLQNGILRVAAEETADRLLVRLMEPHSLMQQLMKRSFHSEHLSAAEKFSVNRMATGTERDFIFTRLESRIGKCPPIAQLFRLLTAAFGRCSQSGF